MNAVTWFYGQSFHGRVPVAAHSLTLKCAKCGATEIIEAEKRSLLVQAIEESGWIYMRPVSDREMCDPTQICPTCKTPSDTAAQKTFRA